MSATAPDAPPGPLVTIGLPVYNGAQYLAAAIASLLAQTHRHIELVISDNASTDDTGRLCRDAAAADARVSYGRLPENIGGVANHARVATLGRGQFFMWASADDLWRPTYIERCLEVLLADPGVVLAYAVNAIIDERGRSVREISPGPPLDGESAVERFVVATDIYRAIEPFYGVMRRAALRRARPLQKHPGFDRILMAELALMGKLRQVPEPLYQRRIHGQQSIRAYPSLRDRYQWINAGRKARLVWPNFSYARRFAGVALRSAPGVAARIGCLWHVLRWCNWHRRELWEDLAGTT